MVMAPATKLWTAAEVQALPDDGMRHEVIDGELLVTPTPTWRHQDAAKQLFKRLSAYLDASAAGDVWFAPADVEFDESTMVEPDLFVVPTPHGRRPRSWSEAGRLLLAVEILSPGTARADRTIKRRLYQREGVPEYWIVDLDARLIDRWRPGQEHAETLEEQLVWHPEGARERLVIELRELFQEILGE